MSASLIGYVIRRLLWAIPVLFLISFFVFLILRLAPGDPVDTILGSHYEEQQAAVLRKKYGYDQPVYQQYFTYLKNLAHNDWGISTRKRDFTVKEVVFPKMWISVRLGLMALVIEFALGVLFGIYAALARGTFIDPLIIGSWLILDAVPTIVLIPVVQYLVTLKLGWVGLGYQGLASWRIVPAILVIALPAVAGTARFTRASILQVLNEDFVRTARAKGLMERTVVLTHVARNAMLPLITVVGLSLPGLTAGVLFVELLYGIPGIGNEALQASLAPDYDVVLAITVVSSASFVIANILIDISYAFIDPRVRLGAERASA